MTSPALPPPYYADPWVRLYHGDCIALLPAIDAEVLVTDPPYGVNYPGVTGDADTSLRDAVLSWWGPERPGLVFYAESRPLPFVPRTTIVWDKAGQGRHTGTPWRRTHEPVAVIGIWGKANLGRGHSVWRRQSPKRGAHPTEKPGELMRWLIGLCPPGVILDPFAGSGSTLRAAKDLGRRAIGIEVEERYCRVAAERLAQEVLPVGEGAPWTEEEAVQIAAEFGLDQEKEGVA